MLYENVFCIEKLSADSKINSDTAREVVMTLADKVVRILPFNIKLVSGHMHTRYLISSGA